MTPTSARTEDVRPAGVPSSIHARQRADRHARVRARVVVVVALLHVAYVLVPILPCVSCRAVVPWLLWVPPLCVAVVFISLHVTVRRWVDRRRQATQFMPLPPVQEV